MYSNVLEKGDFVAAATGGQVQNVREVLVEVKVLATSSARYAH